MAGVSCDECAQLLEGYLEETLADDQRKALEAHVASCETCAALVRDYAAIPGMVRTITEATLPEAVERRLHRLLTMAIRRP